MKYHEIKKIARDLRKQQTPAEKLLWSFLCNKKLEGRRFLRQHPVIYFSSGNEHFFYIPDFYCRKEMLVVELDGPVHNHQKERDKKRDLILQSKSLKVLRINNEELMDIEKVLNKIKKEFK